MNPEEIKLVEQRFLDLEKRIEELINKKAPFESDILDPYPLLVLKRNILKPVTGLIYGADAATADNYGTFFVADRSYQVISISENHRVIGSDNGAVTITVEKCTSGTNLDAGVELCTPLSLKATINTPQFGVMTNTKADLFLKKGDRLAMKDAGVMTAVKEVCLTVLLLEI